MTSGSRRRARETEARPRRKSPARTAILLPNEWFAEGEPRRERERSMTSSWRREAVWMSSVISARRRWEGRMEGEEPLVGADVERRSWKGLLDGNAEGKRGFEGRKGLTSARTEVGEMDSLILEEAVDERRALGLLLELGAVACDMRSTSKGLMYLPSELV